MTSAPALRASAAVRSVDPSSITITPMSRSTARISAITEAIWSASLKAGMIAAFRSDTCGGADATDRSWTRASVISGSSLATGAAGHPESEASTLDFRTKTLRNRAQGPDLDVVGRALVEAERVAHPVDRRTQARIQIELRLPAERRFRLGGVRQQPIDLAVDRAQSLLVEGDRHIAPHQALDAVDNLADRHLDARTEVDHLSLDPLDLCAAHHPLDRVPDVEEIPGWIGGTELDRVP